MSCSELDCSPPFSCSSSFKPPRESLPQCTLLQIRIQRPASCSRARRGRPRLDQTWRGSGTGHPRPNPLLVQVTLTCPGGGPHCIYPMTFKFYSNDGGRFWVYDRPGEPDCGCAEVVEETGPYSLKSYTAFSYGVFVGSGAQRARTG